MSMELRRVEIVDTTLRDGAQSPGVALAVSDRVTIARALAAAGVDEIEVGCPAAGETERAAIQAVLALNLSCRQTAWCRASVEDLDVAEACGFSAVHVSVPGSCLQLGAMDKSWRWVREVLDDLLPWVRRRFAFVSLGIMDAARTKPTRLQTIASKCIEHRIDRVRLADTVGLWNPRTAAQAVMHVRRARDVCGGRLNIGVHTHNDLGMAVGNAVSALEAGASSADVTVLGLGERAGNTPLEELVMALRSTTEMTTDVATRDLSRLCRRVASATQHDVSPHKPIVGSNAFRHESGVHVSGVLRDPRCFEPFDPDLVGRTDRRLDLGTHSGRAGLRSALTSRGVDPVDDLLDETLEAVRSEALRTRAPVTAGRAAAIHDQLAGERSAGPIEHEFADSPWERRRTCVA